MITHIPAREWHPSEQKPESGVDVLGVIGKGKSAYVDMVIYDEDDESWWVDDGVFHWRKVKVTYWTELPNLPYLDSSRKRR